MSQGIDLAGLAGRKNTILNFSLLSILTWKSNQSDKISPRTPYFDTKRPANHPQLGSYASTFKQSHINI